MCEIELNDTLYVLVDTYDDGTDMPPDLIAWSSDREAVEREAKKRNDDFYNWQWECYKPGMPVPRRYDTFVVYEVPKLI